MVWIHGGGWQFGSAEIQNGAALAKYGDVVVVILSYRSRFFINFLKFSFVQRSTLSRLFFTENLNESGYVWFSVR